MCLFEIFLYQYIVECNILRGAPENFAIAKHTYTHTQGEIDRKRGRDVKNEMKKQQKNESFHYVRERKLNVLQLYFVIIITLCTAYLYIAYQVRERERENPYNIDNELMFV